MSSDHSSELTGMVSAHGARASFLSGDYEVALSAALDSGRAFIAVRALIRLQRYDEAIASLRSLDRSASAKVRAEFLLLRGQALTLMGRFAEARDALNVAHGLANDASHLELLVEIRYRLGVLAIQQGYARPALCAFKTGIRMALASGFHRDSQYFYSVDNVLLQHLRGAALCSAMIGDYESMIRFDLEGANTADTLREIDIRHQVVAVAALAVLARDTDVEEISPDSVLRRWVSLPKVAEILRFDATMHRNVAIAKAARGDMLGALRVLKASIQTSSPIEDRIFAIVESARLAWMLDRSGSAARDFDCALELASRVDWEKAYDRSSFLAS